MTQGRRQFLQLAMSAVALPFLGHAAVSQESYPSRPIRLIVGFTPGTAADITGRTFANGASDLLGQQVVVEDKPGAGSSVAAEYVARAAKDGYTLFLSSLSIVTSQIIDPDPGFDLVKDFAPIRFLPAALSSSSSILSRV
jgi:tripartite-type tricarboxylate transporter receptor subunit TctC